MSPANQETIKEALRALESYIPENSPAVYVNHEYDNSYGCINPEGLVFTCVQLLDGLQAGVSFLVPNEQLLKEDSTIEWSGYPLSIDIVEGTMLEIKEKVGIRTVPQQSKVRQQMAAGCGVLAIVFVLLALIVGIIKMGSTVIDWFSSLW